LYYCCLLSAARDNVELLNSTVNSHGVTYGSSTPGPGRGQAPYSSGPCGAPSFIPASKPTQITRLMHFIPWISLVWGSASDRH